MSGIKIGEAFIEILADPTAAFLGLEAKAKASGTAAAGGFGSNFAAAAGLVGAGIGVAALDMAAKFEKGTTLLVTAGGEAKSSLGMVSDGILKIATDTGTSVDHLSDGMYVVEKAGYRGADGLNVLRSSAELAKAENVDLGTATQAVTDIMLDYHMGAGDASKASNELMTASGLAKTTMADFSGSMSTVVPIASSLGIGFDQLGGALATMTQHGETAQQSGQNLNHVISSLVSPTNVTTAAMGQMGLSSTDIASKIGERGLTGTFKMLSDAITAHMGPAGLVVQDTMKKSQEASQDLNTMLKDMPANVQALAKSLLDGSMSPKEFSKSLKGMNIDSTEQGKQFESLALKMHGFNDAIKGGSPEFSTYNSWMQKMTGGQTGLSVATMLTGANMAEFQKNVDDVGGSAKNSGQDISTWADTSKTLSVQLDQVKEIVQVLGIQMGTAMMPAIKGCVEGFRDFFNFLQSNKDIAAALGILITALGTAFGGLFVITKIVGFVKDAKKAFDDLAVGAKLLGTAMNGAMGGWGLIILGIAALVAGLIYAYNHVGWFKDMVDTAFKGIQVAIGAVVDWFTGSVVPFFQQAFQVIGTVAKWLYENAIKPAWDGIMAAAKVVVEWYQANLAPVFDKVGKLLGTIFDKIGKDWATLTKGLSDFWNSNGAPTVNAVQTVFQVLGTILKPIFDVISTLWTGLWTVIQGYWDIWSGIFTATFQAVWDIISAAVKLVWDDIVTVIDTVLGVIGGIIDVAIGLISGNWDQVWTGIKEIFGSIWTGIQGLLSNSLTFIQSVLSAAWNWILGVTSAIWNTIGGVISGAWNWITGIISDAWNNIVNSVSTGINNVMNFFNDLPGRIQGALSGAATWLVNVGENIIQGLMSGITSMAGNVAKSVGDVVNGAIDGAKKLLGIASPSKVFKEIGVFTGQGMAEGVDSTTALVQKSMQSMVAVPDPTKIGASSQIAGSQVANSSLASMQGNTGTTIHNLNVTIDAANVKDFNSVVDIFNNIGQAARTGRGTVQARIA